MTGPHPILERLSRAAASAHRDAIASNDRAELAAVVADGADGTPTMYVDALVEERILEAAATEGVNVLSEEAGWIDQASSMTVIVDPLDGSANAAAGVPLAAFSAALVVDGVFSDALTTWLHTGDQWWASTLGGGGAGHGSWASAGPDGRPLRTTGRTELAGAAVSLLRPHARNCGAWNRVASNALRVRVLGCSTLDSAFVAGGVVDAFADAGSDTHRLVDVAAAVLLAGAAGGAVVDVHGRAIEFDTDLTRRWSGVVAATPELAEALAATIVNGLI